MKRAMANSVLVRRSLLRAVVFTAARILFRSEGSSRELSQAEPGPTSTLLCTKPTFSVSSSANSLAYLWLFCVLYSCRHPHVPLAKAMIVRDANLTALGAQAYRAL